jgi:hypothetical protein
LIGGKWGLFAFDAELRSRYRLNYIIIIVVIIDRRRVIKVERLNTLCLLTIADKAQFFRHGHKRATPERVSMPSCLAKLFVEYICDRDSDLVLSNPRGIRDIPTTTQGVELTGVITHIIPELDVSWLLRSNDPAKLIADNCS